MRTTNRSEGGRKVRLYEGFLEARAKTEGRLREAGLTDHDLHRWLNSSPAGLDVAGMESSLREAGVPDQAFEHILEAERADGPVPEDVARTRLEELLQESASTSDFGTYLSDKATKRLMQTYREEPSSWRQYARTFSVPDFKPVSFVRIEEMADLLPVPEAGPYHDSPLDETAGPQVSVRTFGRLFSITRPALVNDDLNQLRERPAAMGRAAVRTMNKSVVGHLASNPTAYDGTATFSVAHGNLISGAMSEQTVANLVTALRTQEDPNGNRLGIRPGALIAPAELEMVMLRILNSASVPLAGYAPGSTAATPPNFGMGGQNVVGSVVRNGIVEPLLTDGDDFYLTADPRQYPTIAMGFLNGKQTPDVFLADPGMRNVLGTSDPYSAQYDEVLYKVRHDWGVAILDWRGLAKSAS